MTNNKNLRTLKERYVGVHVGNDSVAVAYAHSNGKALDYIAAKTFATGEDPIQKQRALSQFVLDHKLKGVPCCYVCRSTDYTLTMVDAPPVPNEELAQALRWSMQDVINFPLDKAIIEAFEIPMVRLRDNVKLAYAVVTQKSTVSQIEQMILGSGLELDAVDIPELVLRDLISLYPSNSQNVVGLFLQPTGGRLIICRENMIYIARKIDLNLQSLLDPSEKEGSELSKEKDILENLAVEIHRSQDYVNTNFRSAENNSIILAPSILNLTLINGVLKEFLNIDVHNFNLSEILNFREKLSMEEQARCLMAIGASVRYAGETE